MSSRSTVRDRRGALGHAVTPVALLALLALVAGLIYHARRMEASHRATAESALRDYAAFAAWHFSAQADEFVHQSAHQTLQGLDLLARRRIYTGPLPPPEKLLQIVDTSACGIAREARFAFRLDLPGAE